LCPEPFDAYSLKYLSADDEAFFIHIDELIRVMANELAHGRSPANEMAYSVERDLELKADFARSRRNDLCPCARRSTG
jgi:hypothetical protein